MALDTLMEKYGSDKAAWHHNYTPLYEKLFKYLKNKRVNVLEIGFGRDQFLPLPETTRDGRFKRSLKQTAPFPRVG